MLVLKMRSNQSSQPLNEANATSKIFSGDLYLMQFDKLPDCIWQQNVFQMNLIQFDIPYLSSGNIHPHLQNGEK